MVFPDAKYFPPTEVPLFSSLIPKIFECFFDSEILYFFRHKNFTFRSSKDKILCEPQNLIF
jgi:hypothetical protein